MSQSALASDCQQSNSSGTSEVVGTVVGAVIGGLLGSRIGSGSGKKLPLVRAFWPVDSWATVLVR